MNVQETAEAVVNAINAGDWETVASYLADDFQFSGPVPEPLGPEEWIGTNMTLMAGMPDMAFNVQIVGIDGNVVRTVDQMTGTHTADLDLTQVGIGVIPATGIAISLPVALLRRESCCCCFGKCCDGSVRSGLPGKKLLSGRKNKGRDLFFSE